jgi:beta-glucosidase
LAPTENAYKEVQFPAGFLWGAATAAQQIEGAAHEDGRGDSIWDAFCRVPGAIADATNADVACDHYHRMRQDVALLRSMNLRGYRFSTSWARIMPDGKQINKKGLDFYSRLVDELLNNEIIPFLTLYHWDLPQALQDKGGWPNRDTAHRFLDYSMIVHEALADRVRSWTTVNEPWCASYLSYISGEHAPGHHSRSEGIAAAHHLLLGHGLVAEAIKAEDPSAVVGIALNLWPFDAADPENPDDVAAAIKKDGTDNRAFLDPVFLGVYPEDIREWYGRDLEKVVREGDLEIISTPIDLLGLNYYNGSGIKGADPLTTPGPAENAPFLDKSGRHWTQGPSPAPEGIGYISRGLPTTGMGWEVQPEGLTRLLMRLEKDYTGPRGVGIYITENGAAYDDLPDRNGFVDDSTTRLWYIDQHLRALKDAIDAGVDVRGYFAWSLMDTFEWAWGYSKRFGIVYTDFDTQARIPKASGRWYTEVARENALPAVDPEL